MLDMTRWPKHPLLYEINTWPWLQELSAAARTRITLADVPQPELERVAALGFDGVWLMGVWERSPRSREIASSVTDLLIQAHYERLLRAVSDPLFHEGAWQLLEPQPAGISESYRGFIAHQWSSRDARRLVIVN